MLPRQQNIIYVNNIANFTRFRGPIVPVKCDYKIFAFVQFLYHTQPTQFCTTLQLFLRGLYITFCSFQLNRGMHQIDSKKVFETRSCGDHMPQLK